MANQTIWGATDRGPATGSMRLPVDTSSSSTPGFLTVDEVSTYIIGQTGGSALFPGTSGGIPYFSSTTALSSSAALAVNAVVKGGGAGATPTASGVLIDGSNNVSGIGTLASGAHTITSASATALTVGLNGATNPALQIDASTALSATGIKITSAAAAGGVSIAAISSNATENLSLQSKGSSNVILAPGAITRYICSNTTHTFSAGTASTATAARFIYTGAADTALTLSTEAPSIYLNIGQTRQHATGALTLQRDVRVTGSTHSFVGASTLTDCAAFSVDGPDSGGTNATITNSHGIYIPTTALTNVTNGYGLTVNAPSGGTSSNYAAKFAGGLGISVTAGGSTTNAKIGGTVQDYFTDAGNTTTTETDLYSYTVPASTLQTNGDKLQAEYGGIFVSSATASREIKIYFGGTVIFDTGALTVSLAASWTVYCTVIRVSATVVRYMVSLTTEGAALSAYTGVGELTGLTLSNTNILKITGQSSGTGAATNDIVAKLGSIVYQPAA